MVLGRLISVKETNVRYLALETLAYLARVSFVCHPLIVKHRATVFMALKEEPDISIRRRSLDLLYGMCGSHNYKDIVADLLNYLSIADFAIREELVVKIALLGEKFAIEDYQWYINTILQLVSLGGDVVKDDIWHRVVVIVTNNAGLQEYSSRTVFEALMHPSCNEITVKVGAYILGEFGHLIANKPGFK
jgi:AP-2 complex subunit alpha